MLEGLSLLMVHVSAWKTVSHRSLIPEKAVGEVAIETGFLIA